MEKTQSLEKKKPHSNLYDKLTLEYKEIKIKVKVRNPCLS